MSLVRFFSSQKNSAAKENSVKNIMNSFLHGSNEFPPIEQFKDTYSKHLSRGKSVHELSIHNVKPEALEDYKSLIRRVYSKISEDPAVPARLFGSFNTEIGELDQAGSFLLY
jgi:hypothetical protein